MKDESERKGTTLGVRFTPGEIERLDRLVEAMHAETGLEVTRSAAMRAALFEGFETLEAKYGVTKKKQARR
jgi:NifB/MoaA-like Fe-S oxidoreductase